MKIVFDTNVILSAFLTEGIAHRVFNHCIINHSIYISEFITNELNKILEHKFKLKEADLNEFIDFINSTLISIIPSNNMPSVCRDDSDNNILQLADFIKAEIIVSGDKDLLTMNQFEKTRIIFPREYFNEFLLNET